MVDFVENECSVIVSGVLLYHLVNYDLVREEERGKVKREGGRGGRERVGGQGRREEEGEGGRRERREEEEGGGRGDMDWTTCGLQEVKLLPGTENRGV